MWVTCYCWIKLICRKLFATLGQCWFSSNLQFNFRPVIPCRHTTVVITSRYRRRAHKNGHPGASIPLSLHVWRIFLYFRRTCSKKSRTNFPNDIFSPNNLSLSAKLFVIILLLIRTFLLPNCKFHISFPVFANNFALPPIFPVKPKELCWFSYTKVSFPLKWKKFLPS